MSRVVKIYDSNYKVAVQSGGVITLDTGALTGTTVITGNLEVKGATTNVSSTNVNIDDNIIVLSDGTVGNGLPASVQYKSGIEVERGEYENAQWVYDEQVTWTLGGLSSGSLPAGTFYAAVGNQKLPINTPGIVAQGNLYVDTGNGIITVTGTNNYEEKIWNYNNGVVTPDNDSEVIVDDDNIPNAKAVKDYVEFVFASQFYDTIAGGDTSVKVIDETHILGSIVAVSSGSSETTISTQGQHNFTVSDTIDIFGVQSGGDAIENLNGTGIAIIEIVSATAFKVAIDTSGASTNNYIASSGTVRKIGFDASRVKISVEGINNTNFYQDRFETQDIRISENVISTTSSNQDLILSAPGAGAVKINDYLEIPFSPYESDPSVDPVAPVSGSKLYTKTEGTGQTGLYYVNSNNTSDEIVSKNRSLLFSMLF